MGQIKKKYTVICPPRIVPKLFLNIDHRYDAAGQFLKGEIFLHPGSFLNNYLITNTQRQFLSLLCSYVKSISTYFMGFVRCELYRKYMLRGIEYFQED